MDRRILILGATGSIGLQALELISDKELVGFTYFNNTKLAKNISLKFPNAINLSLNSTNNKNQMIQELIDKIKPNIVLNAISGWDGVEFSKLIIENKIDLALANKESLVIAGQLLFKLAKQNKVNIFPVDSEHSSLYELMKIDKKNIKNIYITASGGKYFNYSNKEKSNIKFHDAIQHPNWNMGERISLDSSTLVNKFYELVEVIHFFGNKYNIIPIRQKQSIIHSFIMYKNNSYLFNASSTDMKISIDLALNKFKKKDKIINEIDFNNLVLNFELIDENKHLPIKWFNEFKKTLNYSIGPIVNIVNEFCFDLFKNNLISFNQIIKIINETLNKYKKFKIIEWNDINILKSKITLYLESKFKNAKIK